MRYLIIVLTLFVSSQVWAITVYYSGNDYLLLEQKHRSFFVVGMADSRNLHLDLAWPCGPNVSDKQLTAIFDKWLKSNPEQWNAPASYLFDEAMKEKCPK